MIDTSAEESSAALQRKKWLVATTVVCCGIICALLVLAFARTSGRIGGWVGLALVAAVVVNGITWALRWYFTTTNRQRVFLVGRFPVVIGIAKLSAFAAVTILIVTCLLGLVIGGQFRELTLRAMFFGLLSFALISLLSNGILNAIVVFRHFRGTLAAASRDTARRSR